MMMMMTLKGPVSWLSSSFFLKKLSIAMLQTTIETLKDGWGI